VHHIGCKSSRSFRTDTKTYARSIRAARELNCRIVEIAVRRLQCSGKRAGNFCDFLRRNDAAKVIADGFDEIAEPPRCLRAAGPSLD
jgi:hypothetical protein